MFALNKKTKTKNNKTVVPYSVEGNLVYCFDDKNKTIVLNLEDFDLKKKEERKEIFVKPMIIEDQLFETQTVQEELYTSPEKGKDNNNGFVPDEEYV